MVDVCGPIVDLVSRLCKLIGRQFSHLKSLKDNVETLRGKMTDLSARESDVNEKLETGKVKLAKRPNEEVQLWLAKVAMITSEEQKINNEFTENKKCLNGCLPDYLKRIKLSKLAKKKTQEVDDLLLDSRSWNDYFSDPTPIGLVIPTVDLVGETTAKRTLEIIWESLKDPEKGIIGVYGMGGAGKTTIMKHINNRFVEGKKHINNRFVEEGKLFDIIIWATVSKDFNLEKLQNDIAAILEINVSIYQDVTARAAQLSESLKARKFMLILDDVWAEFCLEDVGIPPPSRENGCKLILTTRSREVCACMGCVEIEVKSLSEGEAWELFKKIVGNNVKFTPNVEKYAVLVARECACLPLAIVTVGSAMKQKVALEVWRNALRELKNLKAKYMNEQVLAHLKFSFDCLSNKMVQECFLYCALYPEDHEIPCKDLVDHWIAEGLMDDDKDWEAERDKGYVVLEELKNSCMLENVEVGEYVKMHDLIRDMAINITSQNNRFMVKAGVGLKGSLEREKWTEGVERISLMNNSIDALPDQPNCPNLSTLLLQGNPLSRNISRSFFEQMHNLRVLNLSNTGIEYLPESFSSLTELRVLNVSRSEIEALPQGIEGAVNLTDIDLSYTRIKTLPSLSRLTELRQLNLEESSIEAVPEGLKGAVNLRYINLEDTRNLQLFPAGILPNLTRLEKLLMIGSGWKWRESSLGGGAGIEEIISLSHLGHLEIDFEGLQGWTPYFTSEKWKSLKCFQFNIGDEKVATFVWRFDHQIQIRDCDIVNQERSGMFPDNTEILCMEDCICRVSLFSNLKDLTILKMKQCGGIEEGIDIVEASIPSKLEDVNVRRCHEMKTVFPLGLFQHLSNLKVIDVTDCKEIEEIAGGEEGEIIAEASNSAITLLPQLYHLILEDLPKLRRVCKRELVCKSLWYIEVRNCPLLKKLPFSVDNIPPSLRLIDISNCKEIEEIAGGEAAGEEGEIIAEASNSAITLLPQLQSLTLRSLPKLRRVCKRELVCESLRFMEVLNCPLLKKLPFSVDNIPPSLEKIEVSNCKEIEEIAGGEAGEEGEIIAEASNSAITLLPKLTFLRLKDLPKLRRVCTRELVCKSLWYIEVGNCPLLKKLPFSVDNIPPDLYKIEGEKEWWDALEWDDPNTKRLLQPFFQSEEEETEEEEEEEETEEEIFEDERREADKEESDCN